VLTDLRLPSMDGLAFLGVIRRQNAHVPVIMMTAFGSVETAVEAMKAGATDFLLKPFGLDHLMQVVSKALEVRALREENRELKAELGRRYEFDTIIAAARRCRKFSPRSSAWRPPAPPCCWPARAVVGKGFDCPRHPFHSPRRDAPWSRSTAARCPKTDGKANCSATRKAPSPARKPPSPASSNRPTTGTVFWTRSATCRPPFKVKLLRILQEREFERLAAT